MRIDADVRHTHTPAHTHAMAANAGAAEKVHCADTTEINKNSSYVCNREARARVYKVKGRSSIPFTYFKLNFFYLVNYCLFLSFIFLFAAPCQPTHKHDHRSDTLSAARLHIAETQFAERFKIHWHNCEVLQHTRRDMAAFVLFGTAPPLDDPNALLSTLIVK